MTLTLASKPAIAGKCIDIYKECFTTSYKSCQAISIRPEDTEIQAKAFCTLGVEYHCLEYATFQVGKEECDKEFSPDKKENGNEAINWPYFDR
jgi:hypothetical protein